MPRIRWNVSEFNAVLTEKNAGHQAFNEIYDKIQNRFIPVATPSEMIKLVRIHRKNRELQAKLIHIVNDEIREYTH